MAQIAHNYCFSSPENTTLIVFTSFLVLVYYMCFLLGIRNILEILIRQGKYKSIYLLSEYIFSQFVLLFRIMSFTTMLIVGPKYFHQIITSDGFRNCSALDGGPWEYIETKNPDILVFLINALNMSMFFKVCLMISLTGMFCMLACKVAIIEEMRGMERWKAQERNIQLVMGFALLICTVVAVVTVVYTSFYPESALDLGVHYFRVVVNIMGWIYAGLNLILLVVFSYWAARLFQSLNKIQKKGQLSELKD